MTSTATPFNRNEIHERWVECKASMNRPLIAEDVLEHALPRIDLFSPEKVYMSGEFCNDDIDEPNMAELAVKLSEDGDLSEEQMIAWLELEGGADRYHRTLMCKNVDALGRLICAITKGRNPLYLHEQNN